VSVVKITSDKRRSDQEEKSIRASGKEARSNFLVVLASVDQPRIAARQSARSRMRACINPKCVSFGRIVYSLATRCPLCKWDLKFTLPASEASAPAKAESAVATR
jgi:hypothetical protein